MILWIVLFVLVLAISFVLAAKSMRDFTEIPTKDEEYSLFLIRKTDNLNVQLLNSIHEELKKSGLIISFERLFKGKKAALVVFGPKRLLTKYTDLLDLLELEDYTNVDVDIISAWEAGIKNSSKTDQTNKPKIFDNLPQLSEADEFWWQLTLSNAFQVQITAVVVSTDQSRRNSLTKTLQTLAPERIIKLPKAFSSAQILDFYKSRSLRKDTQNPILSSEDILQLVRI